MPPVQAFSEFCFKLPKLRTWVRFPSPAPDSKRSGPKTWVTDRTGDIGVHFWAKRVVERLQSFFLQIDVAEIVLHKADQPNTFFDFFDPQGLSCEDRAEINFFAVQTDASAVGDMNDAVVKRISKFWQAAIAADGGSVDFRGALHVQGLMSPFVVELFEKIIEFALLLQAVPTRGARGLRFEREVHAFMAAILLRMTGLDAFDGDAQAQPPDRELGEVEQRVGGGEGHAVV